MDGFNPWIDVAILSGFLAICLAGCYIEHRYNQYMKTKLRGATRVA